MDLLAYVLLWLSGFVLGLKIGRAWKRWEIVHGLDKSLANGDVIIAR